MRGGCSTLLEILADRASREGAASTARSSSNALSQQPAPLRQGRRAFYDQISALHKSVRGSDPDAALYWLVRMLDGGADPLYLGAAPGAHGDRGRRPRRSARAAPRAGCLRDLRAPGLARGRAGARRGGDLLACAAKSNAVYVAYNAARAFVAAGQARGRCRCTSRNAPTRLMKDLGYGKDYRYAHDEPDAYAAGENYFPEGMPAVSWYRPTPRGLEGRIREKLDELRRRNAEAVQKRKCSTSNCSGTTSTPSRRACATRGFALDVAGFEELEKHAQGHPDHAPSSCRRSATRCPSRSARPRRRRTRRMRRRCMAQAAEFGDKLKQLEVQNDAVQAQLREFVSLIPNLPHESVPAGSSAEENVEVRRWGDAAQVRFRRRRTTSTSARRWAAWISTTAAKIAGARFAVMKGGVARLHRALAQFMLDVHTARARLHRGVRAVPGERRLRRRHRPAWPSSRTTCSSSKDRDLYLIPTAEVPVTNFVRDEIVPLETLPLKFVCHSPCFRSEAGSSGKDTRGMIRQHQFDKVELVQIVHPSKSYAAHEELTGARRGDPEEARAALPRGDAVHRRHGLFLGQDLRHRGLAARAERLSRDFLLLQLRGLPGAAHAGALPQRQGQARAGAHAERLGPRGRAHAGRGPGELPERRRLGDASRRRCGPTWAGPRRSPGPDRIPPVRRGEMAEWSIAADSKSVELARVPGVRIPLSPPPLPRTARRATTP